MPSPRPFEIYRFAYKLGEVEYRRPWIVIRKPTVDAAGALRVLVLPCSTKNYKDGNFTFAGNDPEVTGGLDPVPNYVDKSQAYDVDVSQIGPCRGELTGNLLFRFKWWAGIS